MNTEDRHIMTQIEKDIAEIKTALLGNPLSGDRGLVGRIEVLTAKQEILESNIKMLTEEKIKNAVYLKIITWLASIIGVGFVGMVFDFFGKK